jgi:hypothetical protein
MLSIAGVGTARAGNVTQGFPYMGLIYRWIEKIVYPAQRVHGIGNIVQPTLSPVIAQGAVDSFSGQHFAEMPDVVFS